MQIKTFAPTSHKIKAVIYGKSGAGKTYFAASAPKPIFASAEGGLLATMNHKKKIEPIKYVEIKELKDLKDLLMFLKEGKHDFQTVVIDSITEINEIIKDGIEKKAGRGMQLKDWGDLAKAIKIILRGFRDLNMHVIFIAQQKEEKDGDVVLSIVPNLNGKAANEIAYFMDIVAYSYVDKLGQNHITAQPNEKLVTKSRGIEFDGDAPDDFEEWIKLMSSIPLTDQQIDDVEINRPKLGKIRPETQKAILTAWDKYFSFKNDQRPGAKQAVLTATIKKEFAKDLPELTEQQGYKFQCKLLEKIAEFEKPNEEFVDSDLMSDAVENGEITPEDAEIARDNEEEPPKKPLKIKTDAK